MGLRIQNNIAAMNAHRQLGVADTGMSKSLERLSSGYRINRAADDAAGLAISQQMRADIASLKVASRNVSEATSLLQVAEGSMDQMSNMLTRLKELATQASSVNASGNLDKINAEGNKLIEEMDRIANSTEYAGTKLLDGSFGVTLSAGTFNAAAGYGGVTGMQSNVTYTVASASTSATEASLTVSATVGGERVSQTVYGVTDVGDGETKDVAFEALGLNITLNDNWTDDGNGAGTLISHTATASDFQVGSKDTTNDRIGVLLGNSVATSASGLNLASDQLLSASDAQTFLTTLDTAISTLSDRRGDLGAAQNRLQYASANLATTIENSQAAESVIRDVDMAAEMTTFTKNQILLQAGTAMLGQANMAPQNVLSLLG